MSSSKIILIFYKMGFLLTVASIITLSAKKQKLSKIHIIIYTFFAFNFLLYNGLIVCFIALDSVSKVPTQYTCWLLVCYIPGTLVMYLGTIRQRCELSEALSKSEVVLQGLNSSHNSYPIRKMIFSLVKISFVSLNVLCLLVNLYLQEFGRLVNMLGIGLSVRTIVLSASKIFCEPINLHYASVMYNYALGLLFELEASICVYSLMLPVPKLARGSVIFLEDSTNTFDISFLDFNDSPRLQETSEVRGQSSVRVCSQKKLLEVLRTIKNLRVTFIKMFIRPYSLQTSLVVFAYPITMVFINVATHLDTLFMHLLMSFLILSPIVLNTFVACRCSSFTIKIKKEIFYQNNPKVKRLLKTSILLMKDQYTQSNNSCFDLDFEILSVIFDFVVLIATTLFSH